MQGSRWKLQDAKTQFSQVVDAALQGEPQHVTRNGREAVVVLSEASYRSLRENARAGAPGFVAHLLAIPKEDGHDTKRRRIALRDIDL